MQTKEIKKLITGVRTAGVEVSQIYRRDFSIEIKADDSPLTEADKVAHHSLVKLVRDIAPDVPVLSEESSDISFSERREWQRYWLIDPLDGTREFINRNGEFTLNLALIENGVPVFGVVHAPILDTSWWSSSEGAWKQVGDALPEPIRVRPLPDPESRAWKVVGSRLHGSETFEAFCSRLPSNERISMGSSLKLCLVAEGSADLYPRLAPTCEWDTAAAQAVVTAAGGEVLDVFELEPLRYNQKDSLLNPWFIVCARRDARWEHALKSSLLHQYHKGAR